MELQTISFIELYRLKSGLLKQIKELDILMARVFPTDVNVASKLVNEITLGIYDYPFNAILRDRIIFVLEKLKAAGAKDIVKYMQILGDKDSLQPTIEKELDNNLQILIDERVLNQISPTGNDDLIKYKMY